MELPIWQEETVGEREKGREGERKKQKEKERERKGEREVSSSSRYKKA